MIDDDSMMVATRKAAAAAGGFWRRNARSRGYLSLDVELARGTKRRGHHHESYSIDVKIVKNRNVKTTRST